MPKPINLRLVRQASIALAFNLGGLLSGGVALAFFPSSESVPWILLLFPAVLSVRGSIGGILSGKLSTMLHMGEVEPRFRGNTPQFYSLIRAIFFLAFTDTMSIGLLAFIVNLFLGNVSLQHMLVFLLVPSLTCLLAMSVAVPIVLAVGVTTFRRGLDPDVVLYPVMSTVDDVLVTVCYVLVANFVLLPQALSSAAIVTVLLTALFLFVFVRYRNEAIFRRTLIEGLPIVLLSSLLGIFSGTVLGSLKEEITKHPSVLILYPALIDTLGDVGSILGSMQTTKLRLGYVRSFLEAVREALFDLASVEAAAAAIHICFGIVAFYLGKLAGYPSDIVLLVSVALLSNVLSVLFISLFSLLVATETFRHGLDPDNFVIPLVTAVSDLGATLSLAVAIAMLGIG